MTQRRIEIHRKAKQEHFVCSGLEEQFFMNRNCLGRKQDKHMGGGGGGGGVKEENLYGGEQQ